MRCKPEYSITWGWNKLVEHLQTERASQNHVVPFGFRDKFYNLLKNAFLFWTIFPLIRLKACTDSRLAHVSNKDLRPCIPATLSFVGRGWRIGRVDAFRLKGYGFDSRSSRHVGTLGKCFTSSCVWRFGVKLRHSIRAVSGAPLSSSGLEETL